MSDGVTEADAFSFGWEKTKGSLRFFFMSYIVSGLVFIPSGILLVLTIVFAAKSDWTLTTIFAILTVIAWLIPYVALFVAYVKAGMLIAAGEEVAIRDCLPSLGEWWKVLIANCVYATAVGIGLLLCVVPGIWFALKYWSYCWFIVAEGYGPIEALKAAGDLSRGITFDLLFFFVICGIILGLGALAFLIGLAVAFPVVLMATTYLFCKLTNAASVQ